jgi:putative Holliday junction resolvase
MGRVLGVDFGERRLGLAVSDMRDGLALPLRVVVVSDEEAAHAAVAAAVRDTGAVAVVVGLPLTLDGRRGPMAQRAEAFAERLRRGLGIPVDTWDERLTTRLVERTLLDADLSRARRRDVRDKLAAQIMLQGYLDARAARRGVGDPHEPQAPEARP